MRRSKEQQPAPIFHDPYPMSSADQLVWNEPDCQVLTALTQGHDSSLRIAPIIHSTSDAVHIVSALQHVKMITMVGSSRQNMLDVEGDFNYYLAHSLIAGSMGAYHEAKEKGSTPPVSQLGTLQIDKETVDLHTLIPKMLDEAYTESRTQKMRNPYAKQKKQQSFEIPIQLYQHPLSLRHAKSLVAFHTAVAGIAFQRHKDVERSDRLLWATASHPQVDSTSTYTSSSSPEIQGSVYDQVRSFFQLAQHIKGFSPNHRVLYTSPQQEWGWEKKNFTGGLAPLNGMFQWNQS